MAEPVGPTFVPKAVLTTGRVLHQPFEIPTEMTKSALMQGGVTHALVGDLNQAVSKAVMDLKPRGPLAKLFAGATKVVDDSLVTSAGRAKTATEVFWVPFSNGSHQIGHAVSNPMALFYAKRAGFTIPDEAAAAQQLLASITDPNPDSTKFPGFTWPKPPPPPEKPAEEKPVEDKPVEEKPVEDKPVEDKPVEDKPVEDKPVEDKPVDGTVTTTEEAPATDTPVTTDEVPPVDPPSSDQPAPSGGGGDEVVATDQGPATDTGIVSEDVGSPVPEGARPVAPPVDTPVDPPGGATAGATAGAEAVVSTPAPTSAPTA